jgi:hypothetical protein
MKGAAETDVKTQNRDMVIMEKRDFEPLQTIEFNKQLNGA